jgi:hypothetical protein
MLHFHAHLEMSLSVPVSQLVQGSLQADPRYFCSCISQAMLGSVRVSLLMAAWALVDLNIMDMRASENCSIDC